MYPDGLPMSSVALHLDTQQPDSSETLIYTLLIYTENFCETYRQMYGASYAFVGDRKSVV